MGRFKMANNDEAVNELVIYLAHCNRKEHLTTVMDMVRRDAKQEQAIRDLQEMNRRQLNEPVRTPFEREIDDTRRPYAGR